ncbi:MAG TPA: hypothetical protein VGZ68_09395 [Acidimicrobiales bacterium]|nr:hypothetical protein [Acidimicrobiales bacterium]
MNDEENEQAERNEVEPKPTPTPILQTSPRGAPLSLILGGFLALLVSAWAGIVPFVGPTFGFSPDGTASWTWNEVHALGALVPGAAGVLACLLIIVSARRPSGMLAPGVLVASGFLAFLSGAWLAVIPVVWPTLVGGYFHTASPSMTLAYWAGLAVGPGVLLASFGGFAMGRAGREAAT